MAVFLFTWTFGSICGYNSVSVESTLLRYEEKLKIQLVLGFNKAIQFLSSLAVIEQFVVFERIYIN